MRNLLLLIVCLISSGLNGQTLDRKIQDEILKILEVYQRDTLTGGALLLLKSGEPVYEKYFGLANLSEDIQINKDTRFHLNFLTQDFMALAIERFETKNLLSTNDLAKAYIPELPEVAKNVTIHHLLNHTSGLYDYWALKSIGGWDYDDVFKKHQALDCLLYTSFTQTVANRILEIGPKGYLDKLSTYDQYIENEAFEAQRTAIY